MNKPSINRRFPKSEHLTGKIPINSLLKSGTRLKKYPFRILYLFQDRKSTEPKIKVLIGVSKDRFPKASQRNLIKRRIREAYRLNKISLWNLIPENKKMYLGIFYLSNTICEYSLIFDKMSEIKYDMRKWKPY